MNTQSFLNQLLQTGRSLLESGGTVVNRAAGKGGMGSFGSGAAVGGALGLLLGSKRVRKLGGNLLAYGGVAALGALAYRAYTDWQGGRAAAGATAPRTADRVEGEEAEAHSRAMLKALVAAAKADGHIDDRERELIETEMARLDGDTELHAWLDRELRRPLDPAEVARAARTPEMAAEMYLASLLIADDQSFMERTYLDELARQLGLDDDLKARLAISVRVANVTELGLDPDIRAQLEARNRPG
ncbi:MAG: tellurite resistance TerB family protein [Gammaproteobacteria bacterium]|nr:tellurite resistance TerB family protein [Gammaproteobacteria bacterium]